MREIKYGIDTVGNFRLLLFATGSYNCTCIDCGNTFIGDKRARQCLGCAIKLVEKKFTESKRPCHECGGETENKIFICSNCENDISGEG